MRLPVKRISPSCHSAPPVRRRGRRHTVPSGRRDPLSAAGLTDRHPWAHRVRRCDLLRRVESQVSGAALEERRHDRGNAQDPRLLFAAPSAALLPHRRRLEPLLLRGRRAVEARLSPITPLSWRICRDDNPVDALAVGNALYFPFDDGVHGLELWRSDGTAEGTGMLADIEPGPQGSYSGPMIALDDAVLFFAYDAGGSIYSLWRSDGAAVNRARSYATRGGLRRPCGCADLWRHRLRRTELDRSGADLSALAVGRHAGRDGAYPRVRRGPVRGVPHVVQSVRSVGAHAALRRGALRCERRHARARALEHRRHGGRNAARPRRFCRSRCGRTRAVPRGKPRLLHGHGRRPRLGALAKRWHGGRNVSDPGSDSRSRLDLPASARGSRRPAPLRSRRPAPAPLERRHAERGGARPRLRTGDAGNSWLGEAARPGEGLPLFFVRDDNSNGTTLWKTDGTPNGTEPIPVVARIARDPVLTARILGRRALHPLDLSTPLTPALA